MKMNGDINWLYKLRPGLKTFLDYMSEGDYLYFKYSYSGDMYGRETRWGLGALVFAAKIAHIAGLLDELAPIQKENIYKGISSFFSKKGYIYDPLISEARQKGIFGFKKNESDYAEEVRRAETRQSFSALFSLGQKPPKPFINIPYTENGIKEYLSSMNWRNPWHAGSHFSHLLFFLKANSLFFNYKSDKSEALIKSAADWMNNIQSGLDGSWHTGENLSLAEKINGAMKALTGFHAADIYDIPHAKKLADTALSGINDEEACSHFNISYVLYACSLVEPDYRREEIRDFLYKRINLYKEHYYPEFGGFSFRKGKANDNYYGKIITKGKNEPDIHGTIMFTWGLAVIDKVLGLGLNLKLPFN